MLLNKLDNVLQQIGPNCAKEEAPSLEKAVFHAAGVATVKDKEEDEVIAFSPTVIEKISGSTASNSPQNTSAYARIHNLILLAAPQEAQQKFFTLPLFELPLQISGYSTSLAARTSILCWHIQLHIMFLNCLGVLLVLLMSHQLV